MGKAKEKKKWPQRSEKKSGHKHKRRVEKCSRRAGKSYQREFSN